MKYIQEDKDEKKKLMDKYKKASLYSTKTGKETSNLSD